MIKFLLALVTSKRRIEALEARFEVLQKELKGDAAAWKRDNQKIGDALVGWREACERAWAESWRPQRRTRRKRT